MDHKHTKMFEFFIEKNFSIPDEDIEYIEKLRQIKNSIIVVFL